MWNLKDIKIEFLLLKQKQGTYMMLVLVFYVNKMMKKIIIVRNVPYKITIDDTYDDVNDNLNYTRADVERITVDVLPIVEENFTDNESNHVEENFTNDKSNNVEKNFIDDESSDD